MGCGLVATPRKQLKCQVLEEAGTSISDRTRSYAADTSLGSVIRVQWETYRIAVRWGLEGCYCCWKDFFFTPPDFLERVTEMDDISIRDPLTGPGMILHRYQW